MSKNKKKLNKKSGTAGRAAAQSAATPEVRDEVRADEVKQADVKAGGRFSRVASRAAKYVTAAVVLLVLFWFGFTYEVREGSCAVVLRFGAVRTQTDEAGLYMKLPWPFETVVTYDDRLITMESNKLETTTKDKRNIIIQSYVVYEIADPVLYHNSVGAQGTADSYIKAQISSATNSTMGAYELSALVSLETEKIKIDEIQNEIFTRVRDNCLANYGINVVDVSILRLSLPSNNLEAVFEQMRADREKDIDKIIAEAEREANKITTDADTEASEIVGGGITDAALIRAQTETEVARIYAEAQAANIELYQFLKNLDTVVSSVNSSTILVVKADEYPFNILTEYSKYMEIEGNKTVINDLTYILTQLPVKERTALIDKITALLAYVSLGEQTEAVDELVFLLAQLEGEERNALTAEVYELMGGGVVSVLEEKLASLAGDEKKELEGQVLALVNYRAVKHSITIPQNTSVKDALALVLDALESAEADELTVEVFGVIEPGADNVADALTVTLSGLALDKQAELNLAVSALVGEFAERNGVTMP